MLEITVSKIKESENGAEYSVKVDAGDSHTEHTVVLANSVYERYSGSKVTAEALIEKAFEFLLERESKEAILANFKLELIEHYFPEFGTDIINRLGVK